MPDSCLAPFDAKLASAAQFVNLVNGASIPFQFAPHVVGQSNSSSWLEKDLWSIEPLKIHKGSNGKKMNVEWEYIATDSGFGGAKIAKIIRDLNAYFFEFKEDQYPLVQFTFGEIAPGGPKFRLMQADISYGPEIVQVGGQAYYFYTKVAVSLELSSTLQSEGLGEDAEKIDVEPLASVQPQWY